MRIASFDIGKKNLAFYVEDANTERLLNLESKYNMILKKDRKRKGGILNPQIKNILDELFLSGTHVDKGYGVFDIRNALLGKDNTVLEISNTLDVHVRANLFKLLESYMWLWKDCDVVCIEQQFFNSRGANLDAIKIGECVFSWFVDNFYPFKVIEYFGSQYKTQLLGAPHRIENKHGVWKLMSKQDRKNWSVEKAEEIFLLRNELSMATMFGNAKKGNRKKRQHLVFGKHKMDDIADCVIQTQAFKFKKIVAKIDFVNSVR